MKKYELLGSITLDVYTEIEAESHEQAMAIARERAFALTGGSDELWTLGVDINEPVENIELLSEDGMVPPAPIITLNEDDIPF